MKFEALRDSDTNTVCELTPCLLVYISRRLGGVLLIYLGGRRGGMPGVAAVSFVILVVSNSTESLHGRP